MALFGLSDITFQKGSPKERGPLAALVDNQFKTKNFLKHALSKQLQERCLRHSNPGVL